MGINNHSYHFVGTYQAPELIMRFTYNSFNLLTVPMRLVLLSTPFRTKEIKAPPQVPHLISRTQSPDFTVGVFNAHSSQPANGQVLGDIGFLMVPEASVRQQELNPCNLLS